jgi:anti-sigma factor RsiW
MSCESVQRQLLGFHFGEVEEAARQEVEAHLPECRACLASYLALKRGVETAEAVPRPSAASRQALRAAVAQELGLAAPTWRWWERPLAFGFAGAALVLAVMTVHLAGELQHQGGAEPTAPPAVGAPSSGVPSAPP